MPASDTSGHSFCSRGHPTCWASSQRSHTVSSMPYHWVWTSAPLNSHPFPRWERTASQIETPICTHRTTTISSSDSNNRRAALCADSEVAGEHCETLYFHLRHRHPLSHNDPARNSVVQPYRHPTGVRRFRSCLHKWGMDTSAACECGAEAGPPRDISPGVTKTDTGPSYFLGPSSKLVLFVYWSEWAVMLRFTNRLIVVLAVGSH